ncbi:biotin--[acetyl-CoA-carboxylase] ligase [Pelagibacterium limicola]|uniref:biotin--[acetyl-CoA-carboxylase] ligase n=1 Tax=Pelagibacterium limicola TaxID=2791022 RepID=UPI0031B612A0
MPAFPLSPLAVEAGYRVLGFDSIGSTNAAALLAAKRGESSGIWYAALQQTEGRGRRGRAWESPHGNLAASLMIVPDAETASLGSLGFVAGVALNKALGRILPAARLRTGLDGADAAPGQSAKRLALKWPNDVLADGHKLAGILLEAQKRDDGRTATVIGFGVNVVAAPQGLPYPATSLRDLGSPANAETVFEALAESWVEAYTLWDNGIGLPAILALWRENAAGIGAEVAVQRNNDVLRGVFETIDDAGRLIVRDNEGHRTAITAGDVHFGTTATLRQ